MADDLFEIKIATGAGSNLGRVKNETVTWRQFGRRMQKIYRDGISIARWNALTKRAKEGDKKARDEQNRRKAEAGYFCQGWFEEGRRKKDLQQFVSIICLDVDDLEPEQADYILGGHSWLTQTYTCLVSSTRSHTAAAPRLRVVVPLKRHVKMDEGHAIGRILGSGLLETVEESMDAIDDVSFRANRRAAGAGTEAETGARPRGGRPRRLPRLRRRG
ncbi:hypothetical protein P1J78_22120 [Psychromarinibacter sp. C21-152]|uniref:Uncharacterized protein n=1 Tax=Psychromarinibacter sediminicola TaxID=3033385 RepID=A0AAE3NWI5_9RHOB|nr:hypothetical protein [Psychromarinibacter sediminicola]MDF0603432.1 hypothetical protein [Psychromarinibacter sediminicola]